jgi:hypothetical protein
LFSHKVSEVSRPWQGYESKAGVATVELPFLWAQSSKRWNAMVQNMVREQGGP